eukprot:TRINITY_DN7728_c0_g4_i1.p1 TRINITY_DN7728_c0_g4~~TRINITY_DN7728_c0_g4_i1.p1  ORF type:complete len:1812 (+),score=548.52 TRINITY_DN7728_c0_g4_i1:86-5521(+)
MGTGRHARLLLLVFAGRQAAAAAARPATHMLARSCHALQDGWGYLNINAAESPVVAVGSARAADAGPFEPPLLPLARERRIAFHRHTIAYTDRRASAGAEHRRTLRVTTLGNVGIVYLPRRDFIYETALKGAGQFFTWHHGEPWRKYLEVTDEGTSEVLRSVRDVRQVATDGAQVLWVGLSPGGEWYLSGVSRGPDARWAPVDVGWQGASCGTSGTHIVDPVICGRRTLVTEVPAGGGRGRVLSYDHVTETAAELFPTPAALSTLSPAAWEVDPQGDSGCAYAAVELPGAVRVASSAADLPAAFGPVPGAAYPAAVPLDGPPALAAAVVVIELPSRERLRIGPAARAAAGVGGGAIWGIAGGGGHLYILIAAPGGSGPAFLVTAQVTGSGGAVLQRQWDFPAAVGLHSAIPGAAVVALPGAGLHLLRVPTARAERSGLPPEMVRYNCSLEVPCETAPCTGPAGRVGLFAAYVDTVVWSASGGASGTLWRGDLDKDNDGLLDTQDRFPLSPELTWDSDNDGEGNEMDLVRATGSCTDTILHDPGACISDLVVMYSVWGGVTGLLFAVSMLLGMRRRSDMQAGLLSGPPPAPTEGKRLAQDDEDEADEILGRIQQNRRGSAVTISSERSGVDAPGAGASRAVMWRRVEALVQGFLMVLTIFSVALVFVPMWNLEPLGPFSRHVFSWIDVYAFSCFFTDLAFRYVFRDDEEETCLQFLCRNWYDIPSLWCDPPGVAQSGTGLDLLVITRLLRIMRLLRIFRMLRLYRRLTGSLGNRASYVRLVLQYTQWLVPIIVLVLVITMSVLLKIVEQSGQQEKFGSYWDCIWFSVVTVTTVGYGDRSPQHWFGRVLSCLMMVSGIGMIGNVTARVSETIQASGANTALRQERMGLASLWDNQALRSVLRELSVAYNPLLAIKDMRNELVNMRSRSVIRMFGSDRYPDPDAPRRAPQKQHRRGSKPASVASPAESTPDASGEDPGSTFNSNTAGESMLKRAETNPDLAAKITGYQRLRKAVAAVFQRAALEQLGYDPETDSQSDEAEWSVPAAAVGAGLGQDPEVRQLIQDLPPEERFPFERVIARLCNPRMKRREVTLHELVLELEITREGLARRHRAQRAQSSKHTEAMDEERAYANARSDCQRLISRIRLFQQRRALAVEDTVIMARRKRTIGETLGVKLDGVVITSIHTDGAAHKHGVKEFSSIREVNGVEVTTAAELKAVFAQKRPQSPGLGSTHGRSREVAFRVRERPVAQCEDLLHFIFLQHKLDEEYKGIEDWETLERRLACMIFQRPNVNGLVVEKIFAIRAFEESAGAHEGDDPEEQEKSYDWQDPIEERFGEAEEVLAQHGVGRLETGSEIIRAVQNQILRFDRVECMRWMLHHLQWAHGRTEEEQVVVIPHPPLNDQRPDVDGGDPRLHHHGWQLCGNENCSEGAALLWVPPTIELTLTVAPGVGERCDWGALSRAMLRDAGVPCDALHRVQRAFSADGLRLLLLTLRASPSRPEISVRSAHSRLGDALSGHCAAVTTVRPGNMTLQASEGLVSVGDRVEGKRPGSSEWIQGVVDEIVDGAVIVAPDNGEASLQLREVHCLPADVGSDAASLSLRRTGELRGAGRGIECDGHSCRQRRDRQRRVSEWPGLNPNLANTMGSRAVDDLRKDPRGYLRCGSCGWSLCSVCACLPGEEASRNQSHRSRSSFGSFSGTATWRRRHSRAGSYASLTSERRSPLLSEGTRRSLEHRRGSTAAEGSRERAPHADGSAASGTPRRGSPAEQHIPAGVGQLSASLFSLSREMSASADTAAMSPGTHRRPTFGAAVGQGL